MTFDFPIKQGVETLLYKIQRRTLKLGKEIPLFVFVARFTAVSVTEEPVYCVQIVQFRMVKVYVVPLHAMKTFGESGVGV